MAEQPKRLYRRRKGRKLLGVLGGLAEIGMVGFRLSCRAGTHTFRPFCTVKHSLKSVPVGAGSKPESLRGRAGRVR